MTVKLTHSIQAKVCGGVEWAVASADPRKSDQMTSSLGRTGAKVAINKFQFAV